MSTTEIRPSAPEHRAAPDRRPDVGVRIGLVLVAVLIAAWPSLWSLAQQWRFQSALAELAIVPVLFAALLVLAARRHEYIAAARWGRADWWVAGVAAIAIPAILWAARIGAENFFPTLRLDLLLLPLVAVAAIALTFGTRSLLAFAPAVLVLVLAWPLPFQAVLEQVSRVLTTATGAAVGAMVDVVPIAERLPSDGDLLLRVPTSDGGFEVVVSSACAGAGGMAAFLVVGIASFAWLAGKVSRRILWLALGLTVVFIANALRIVAILATGRLLGEPAAIGLVHPLAGLVSLNVAFVIMLLLARPLGLVRRPASAKFNDNPLFGRLPGDQPADSRQVALRVTALLVGAALLGSATAALVRIGTATDQPLSAPAV
jgi:exosortase/archaeosortase family protein